MEAKILIIEDDPEIRELLTLSLGDEGFDVKHNEDIEFLLKQVVGDPPDLILLDRVLEQASGLALCRKIRAIPKLKHIPIMIISRVDDEISDSLQAFDAGADDYIAAPFEVSVLLARIRALCRRSSAESQNSKHVLKANNIVVDLDRWMAYVEGSSIPLTLKEFRLLRELIDAKGRVLTRDDLLNRVWGHNQGLDLNTRTVDIHLSRLRRKLGKAGDQILTIRNVGYRLDQPGGNMISMNDDSTDTRSGSRSG